jgi:hypothetical protein
MAKLRNRAGKKSKNRKHKKPNAAPRARRAAPSTAAPAAAVAQPQAPQAEQHYPCNVLVKKGGDQLPVTVTDAAHHQRLVAEYGAEQVEVQS